MSGAVPLRWLVTSLETSSVGSGHAPSIWEKLQLSLAVCIMLRPGGKRWYLGPEMSLLLSAGASRAVCNLRDGSGDQRQQGMPCTEVPAKAN